jgi:hypothetical protein
MLVGVEAGKSQINTNNIARIFSPFFTFHIQTKLSVVPIGSADHSYPVNLGVENLLSGFTIALEGESACSKTIGECDSHAIG